MLDNTKWNESLRRQIVVQALDSAHDYIQRYGWRQAFGRRGQPVCLVKSITMQNLDWCVEQECRAHISAATGTIDLVAWNDSYFRTKRQVLDALKQARAKAEAPHRESLLVGD